MTRQLTCWYLRCLTARTYRPYSGDWGGGAVLPGIKKISFIGHPQSEIIVRKTCAYRNPVYCMKDQLWLLNVSCWPFVSSPPLHFSCLMYIWWELYMPSLEEKFLHTQCRCHSVNALSSSPSATSFPFFILYWERVIWPLFWLSLHLFLTRSLGFLKLLSISSLSIFGRLLQGPVSCLAIMRTILHEWTWPDGSPWACLVLSSFGCLSRGIASHLTVPRTIWVDLIRTIPLGFC